MKRLSLLILSVVLLTGCSNGGASRAEQSFIAGTGVVTTINKSDRVAAPALFGMTLQGTQYSFEVGKVAVVNVWASWCSPCRAEEPALSALSKKYSSVEFIGILTRDNPVNAEAFVRRQGTPYPTLIDDSLLIGFKKSLPANAIPTTVVIDRQGKVAARISGAVTIASLSNLIEKVSAE
ncbi:MAG: TlpA disulfide reductase family protein [Candidatus Planktophila sp.]|jgi:thiol-disulfide isomerase/thioredoxin|tara:strand:+ start:6050 stop:6586 length:537 start_codon:yes stop_codon:yes gene_type:complete